MLPNFQNQTHKYLHGKVLDIGYVSKPLQMETELYGVDIQPAPCPTHFKEVKVANLNAEPIPYADGFFDSVFAGETFEHVANPVRLLAECNRVLVADGVLVLTIPNPYYWIEVLRSVFPARFKSPENDQHFSSPTRLVVRACAKRTSFVIEKEEGTFCHIPIIKKKVMLPRWPTLTSQIIYVLRKTGEFKNHSIVVSRPHGRPDLPKEFQIDARLF